MKRVVAFCGLSGLSMVAAHAAPAPSWVATWSASPDSTLPTLAGTTVREAIRTSVGGTEVRLELSNVNGTGPVTLGPVRVAQRADGAAIVPGSDHAVMFHGQPTVTLAKGGTATSDPVAMTVSPWQALAVSIHVGDGAGATTAHGVGNQTAWIAKGDATGDAAFPVQEKVSSRLFLTGVDVAPGTSGYAIAVLGDSISDGVGSTPDTDARWPDDLASALQHTAGMNNVAVLDEGVAGNRVLHDEHLPFIGPSALTRLDADALNKPGVRYVVLLEGINDISASSYFPGTPDDVTAQQIIDGMKTIVARAHARKVKVIGATLLPFDGLEWPFHSADGEAKRQAVNAWIRNGHAFDGVVDTDKALRDPAHPERLLAAYDSGDHLHPNDAGHKAIAAAFDIPVLFAKP
ncbi:SGNH/GDSL hydrolase family protein [Dyella sp. C11]|uniref:SGNH/GDSL hydrolase family protein n=1 Tax=Dyella sp. C11 TaxID=2126991 RepID=UPI0013005811|nr:SGNH/GDSL hydrolase family protein [Dyella sp. C11]